MVQLSTWLQSFRHEPVVQYWSLTRRFDQQHRGSTRPAPQLCCRILSVWLSWCHSKQLVRVTPLENIPTNVAVQVCYSTSSNRASSADLSGTAELFSSVLRLRVVRSLLAEILSYPAQKNCLLRSSHILHKKNLNGNTLDVKKRFEKRRFVKSKQEIIIMAVLFWWVCFQRRKVQSSTVRFYGVYCSR